MSRGRTVQLRSLMTEALYREITRIQREDLKDNEDPDMTRIATSPIEDERRGWRLLPREALYCYYRYS